MKKRPYLFFLIPVLLVTLSLLQSACTKEIKEPGSDRAVLAPVAFGPNTLSGVLGTGHNVKDVMHLAAGIWHLNGLVYVDSADVLIIDPGAVIQGDRSTDPLVPGGGLVITRGARIMAQGTETNPIIFTSASTTPVSGDWCGLIIIGNASSNDSARVRVDGVPVVAGQPDVTYGGSIGTNDSDTSGVLKYVRIEYAGYELSVNNWINGLTLAGVGSGTVIDFVEVFKTRADAFQFLGGTVNASHLLAIKPVDDLFDINTGYRGTIRYALGVADTTRSDISTSNGIESDNNLTGSAALPVTHPVFKRITVVGLPNVARATFDDGAPSGVGRYGRAAHLRRNTEFEIDSSIFLGYNFGLSLDDALGNTSLKYRNGISLVRNTFVHAFFTGTTPAGISPYITEVNGNPVTGANFHLTTPAEFYNVAIAAANNNRAYVNANPNGNIMLTSPFSSCSASSFLPVILSPARQYGAFPNAVNWITGTWARFC